MKYFFLAFISLIVSVQTSSAQTLKGKITDNSGQPVPYATVYIEEIRQGTTSNTRGDYEIKLRPGKYAVVFQSLGYEPVFENLELYDTLVTRNITLREQIYEIPPVQISPSGEDPAYYIMRKAIGLAPYYLSYIDYYKAEVYLKGNLVINRIPKIIQKSMRMNMSDDNVEVSAGGRPEKNADLIKEGDSFLMESFNEIEFNAPDKYTQRVISYNTSFPEQGENISPMDFIQASFYQPTLVDLAISPLSPQAFSHYDFRYLGVSLQGNYTVNKIEVKPKRKSQQLFTGTIFIMEDLWCLHSVDLTNENLAGTIRVKQLYIPVSEEVWMPVSHQFDVELGIFGFKADASYSSAVKYLDVKTNSRLQKPDEISPGYTAAYNYEDTSATKKEKEIERILRKDELTNRDMVKLSRLMKKESEESRPDSVSKSLEIKDNTIKIVEEGAGKKDSTYWAEIRPIPLSDIEIRSLQIRDSIKADIAERTRTPEDTASADPKRKRSPFRTIFNNVITGHTWSDTSGFSFSSGGLVNLQKLSFNTVDGFIVGTDFRINKRFSNQSSIGIYPEIRYAFSRQKLMWRVNASISPGGKVQDQLFIRSGISSRDISTGGGINPLINSLSSLLFRNNYMKLYESRYLTLGYTVEVLNGLKFELSAGYENRKVLENNTSFSIFRTSKEYSDNIPDNDYLLPEANPINFLNDQKHLEIVTNVTFIPYQKYRMVNGTRIPMGSDWPVLNFIWKHGLNRVSSLSDRYNHFNMFRLEVSQTRETGPFSELRWRIRAGGFADNRNISYFDFVHFNSQSVMILIDNYDDAFMLPLYYSLSTPEFYGEMHLRYTTPYLLLKLLPGLSNTLIRENLIFSYLGSRFNGHYTEIGYSLSEIFLLGEIGIYAGFDDITFRSIGAKIVLRLN